MWKRNKFALLVAMPILVVPWLFGWVFYYLGGNKRKARKDGREVCGEMRFGLVAPEEKLAS
jgi:hypothetical protein